MTSAVKTLKKWAVNLVFGENFQGFADMKEYENGTETYDRKSLMRAVEGYTRKFDKDRNRIKTKYHPPANANRIKQIVELGPDSGCDYVTTEFSTYSTPLIEAVRKGNAEAAAIILSRWPDKINKPTRFGIEPIRWAILKADSKCFELLVNAHPDHPVKKLVAIWLQEIQNDFDQVTDRDIASIRSVFEDEPEPGDATAEAVLNRNEKIKNAWSPYQDQKRLVQKVHKFWSVLKKKLISDPEARHRARVDFRQFFGRNRRSKIFTTLLKEIYEDMVYVLKEPEKCVAKPEMAPSIESALEGKGDASFTHVEINV